MPRLPSDQVNQISHHRSDSTAGKRFSSLSSAEGHNSSFLKGLPLLTGIDGANGLNGAFSRSPFPLCVYDPTKIPADYYVFYDMCRAPGDSGDIMNTRSVYNLFCLSGLSNEILGEIWSIVNRSKPGILNKSEFFFALALIAMCQVHGMNFALERWPDITCLPVPKFNLPAGRDLAPAKVTGRIANPSVRRLAQPIFSIQSIVAKQTSSSSSSSTSSSSTRRQILKPTTSVSNRTVTSFRSATSSSGATEEYTEFQVAVPSSGVQPGGGTGTDLSSVNWVDTLKAVSLSEQHGRRLFTPIGCKTNNSFEDCLTARNPAVAMPLSRPFKTDFGQDLLAGLEASLLSKSTRPATNLEQSLTNCSLLNDLQSVGGTASSDGKPSAATSSSNAENSSLESSIKDLSTEGSVNQDNVSYTSSKSDASPQVYDAYENLRLEFGRKSETCETNVDVWTRCLEACLKLLKRGCDAFAEACSSIICKEVFGTHRGMQYLKGIIQVYMVARRISCHADNNIFPQVVTLVKEVETVWQTLATYLSISYALPDSSSVDFRPYIPDPATSDTSNVCALCLLMTEKRRTTEVQEPELIGGDADSYVLEYAGRHYHAQCANLWINCIDPLLPTLRPPQLLS